MLTGGPGRDTYIFAAGSGHDTVANFQDTVDKLDVSAFGYHSLADLQAAGGSVAADGTGTLITMSAAGETVRLDFFPPGQISDADFVFAPVPFRAREVHRTDPIGHHSSWINLSGLSCGGDGF